MSLDEEDFKKQREILDLDYLDSLVKMGHYHIYSIDKEIRDFETCKPKRLNTELRIESNNNHSEMGLPILNTIDIIIGTLL